MDLPEHHTRRSTSPLVLWLWSTLEYRSDADRWLVLCAARGSLTDTPNTRVEAHLRVLFRYREQPGGSAPLSRRSYSRWRDQQEDRSLLPSPTSIANTFGGWHEAADAIGERAAPVVLARRYTARGPAFTTTNLREALVLWGRTNPERTYFSHYRAWALAELHKPQPALPRISIAPTTFYARFGSWPNALEAAGLKPVLPPAPENNRRLTRNDIVRDIQTAVAAHGGSRPTVNQYLMWRNAELEAGRSAPTSLQTIQNHFGTWLEALGAAGVLTEAQVRAARRRGGRRHKNQVVHRYLKQAIEAQGRDLGHRCYERWRTQLIEAEAKPRPPSYQAIRERHGSWPAAIQFTLDHWDEESPVLPKEPPLPDNPNRWHRVDRASAADSLVTAMDELGVNRLTKSEYAEWRDAQPEPAEFVAPTSLRRMFGAWSSAVEAALEERQNRKAKR